MCACLTLVSDQRHYWLNICLLVGLLDSAEPVLQVLKALVVGDVVDQEDSLEPHATVVSFLSPVSVF